MQVLSICTMILMPVEITWGWSTEWPSVSCCSLSSVALTTTVCGCRSRFMNPRNYFYDFLFVFCTSFKSKSHKCFLNSDFIWAPVSGLAEYYSTTSSHLKPRKSSNTVCAFRNRRFLLGRGAFAISFLHSTTDIFAAFGEHNLPTSDRIVASNMQRLACWWEARKLFGQRKQFIARAGFLLAIHSSSREQKRKSPIKIDSRIRVFLTDPFY